MCHNSQRRKTRPDASGPAAQTDGRLSFACSRLQRTRLRVITPRGKKVSMRIVATESSKSHRTWYSFPVHLSRSGRVSAFAVAACLIASVVVDRCAAPEQRYTLTKLPSGRVVKIISVGTMYFSADDPALMLKYQTDLSISDVVDLTAEADDIWPTFKKDVERAGLKNAIVSATSPSSGGFVSRTTSYNFVYKKAADGSWHRLPSRSSS